MRDFFPKTVSHGSRDDFRGFKEAWLSKDRLPPRVGPFTPILKTVKPLPEAARLTVSWVKNYILCIYFYFFFPMKSFIVQGCKYLEKKNA